MSAAEGVGLGEEAAWTTEEGATEAGTLALVLWVDEGDGVTATASTEEVVPEGDGGYVSAAGVVDGVGVTATASTEEVVPEGEGVSEAGTTAELGLLVTGVVDAEDDVISTASTDEVVPEGEGG